MATWLEDVLSQLQGGGAPAAMAPSASPFPDVQQAPTPEQEAAMAAAAREAAGQRMIAANQRRSNPFGVPDMNGAGVQLGMGDGPPGTGVPVPPAMATPDGSPFGAPNSQFQPMGIPPSLQLASSIAAPPPASAPPPVPGALPPHGAVPMPQARPAAADAGEADTPPNATPTQGGPAVRPAAPMGMPPAAPAELPLAQRIANIGPGLMGIGAAMQGDMGHLATANAQKEQALQLQAQHGNATARLLASKGASAPEIQAAISGGPETIKALLGQYMGKDKFAVVQTKEVEDQYGSKRKVFQVFNSNDGTFKDVPADSAADAKVQASAIDPGLTGDAAISAAQTSNPALLKQAMAFVEGRESWPSATARKNPRIQAATDLARQIDPNLTEQDAIARKKYMEDAANTKSGVGFQVKGFHQGIEHLWTMAKDIEKFNPSDGAGSADLAHAVNSVKQRFGESSGLARNIQGKAQAVAGEVGKLYSGQTGGGVHERERTANLFSTGRSSATELAGSLQGTIDLMEGGLKSLEVNRDRVMGEKGSQNSKLQYRNPETDARIGEIQRVINRLKGAEAAAPAAASVPKPGNYVWKNGALVPE